MKLLPREDWVIEPIPTPDGRGVLGWYVGAWVHDNTRVWALADPGLQPEPAAAPSAHKPWPKGLPAGFEGLDVIEVATGRPVVGVIRFGEDRVTRLKTDADGDFIVDPLTGKAIEEKVDGHFRHLD